VIDDDGHAVIIDFDSCASIEAKSWLDTWLTHPKIAEVANDEHSFNLVARFIQGEYDSHDFTALDM